MARAARAAEPNLALAATRPGGDEDTLTEVFAGVMEVDQQLAQEVLWLACGNEIEPASAVRVHTQCVPRSRAHIGKVDMWLDAGSTSCWIENKLEAQFGPDQLPRYSKLGPGLVIVPEKRREEVPGGDWQVATWPDIANLARSLWDVDGTGESAARLPTAEARHKARADFISYLEERHNVPKSYPPLSAQDDAALAKASYVLSTAVPCLLEAVCQRARKCNLEGTTQLPTVHRDYGYLVVHPKRGTWAEEVGGLYEARVDGNPDFAEYPVLGVGLTVYKDSAKASLQRAFAGPHWQDELEKAGFGQLPSEPGWRVFRLFRPHELQGDLLEDQAKSAADEFMRAYDDLQRLECAWRSLDSKRAG